MRKLVLFLILGMLVFSAYSNTFESPPVLDDFHSFVHEPLVQKFDWSSPAISNLAGSKFGVARLIPMLTLANDYWRGGGDISPFHVTNLIIHLSVTLAVFFLAWLLFEISDRRVKKNDNENFYWAFFVAGLWSLSPVQTAAVTYIVQRMATLVAFFYIFSITTYFFARYSGQKGEIKKSRFFYLLFFVLAIAAFMSKENSITIIFVVILGEILFFPEAVISLVKNNKFLASLSAVILFVLCFLIIYKLLPDYLLGGYNHRRFDLWQRLLTQGRIVMSYILLLILPLPQYLCLDHHVELSSSLLNPLTTLISLISLLAIIFLAIMLHKKRPLYSFAIGWFFVTLIIESSVVALELKFEHRLYLPSVGFFLLSVALVKDLQRFFIILKKREFLLPLIFVLCSILSLLTYRRNQAWATSVSINADTVAKSPLKARAHSNLGSAYFSQGMYTESIESSWEAINLGFRFYEEYWVSANNLILSYSSMQMNSLALLLGRDLLTDVDAKAKANSLPLFLSNMAIMSMAERDWLTAYQYSLRALTLVNDNQNIYNLADVEQNMLVVLRKSSLGGDDKIVLELGLINRNPDAVFFKMANLFTGINNYERADFYIEKCLQIAPRVDCILQLNDKIKNVNKLNKIQKKYGTLKNKYVPEFWKDSFHFKMSLLYLIEKSHIPTGRFFEATYDNLKDLKPGSSDPWLLESWHYYRNGKSETALELIEKGIALNPDYAQLWVNKGIYEMSLREFNSAKQNFLRVFELYPGYPKRNYILGMITATDKGLEHFSNSGLSITEGGNYE